MSQEDPPIADSGHVRMAERPDPKRVASLNTLLSLCDYLSGDEKQRLKDAYRLSDEAHLGQVRTSGEPYISHPIAVTEVCARWRLDVEALMAALLHDVVEDCNIPLSTILERFGPGVASMVDGLSKIDRAEFANREIAQAENFRKMLLAMSRDVRVILIKLADRLHNMQTLDAVPRSKQHRVALETLDIYAPIADRLGLSELYRELSDLAFKYQHPYRFSILDKAVQRDKRQNRHLYKRILEALDTQLELFGVEAAIESREKTLFSIYKKMQAKHQPFASVMDVYAFRLVVNNQAQCYLALGAIHAAFRPISDRFKDYIANPKANGYQSIHTSVFGLNGTPVEFQIRTREMHRQAEAGVAAHWLYKAKEESFSDLQTRTHRWLQGLLEMQSNTRDSLEFLEHVKVDLYPDAIYVFTPKGSIRALPKHATALDFAFGIHTDIGIRATLARVNGREVPLRTELNHGDIVEVITDSNSTPNTGWLHYVRTGKARNEIRHYLRTRQLTESIDFGRQLLEQALAAIRIDSAHVTPAHFDRALQDAGATTLDNLYADIGLGKILPAIVARAIARQLDPDGEHLARTVSRLPVLVRGTEGMTVQFARCCRPLPGDEIVGQMLGGHGLILHRDRCETAQRTREKDPDRWIEVAWAKEVQGLFQSKIAAFVSNEPGLLSRVTGEIASSQSNIVDVRIHHESGSASNLDFTVEVQNRDHLARMLRVLRRVPGVIRVERVLDSPPG